VKRILVPSNCDKESEIALKLAAGFARANHAKIYVIRVIKTHGGAYFDRHGEIVEDHATDVQKYKTQKADETLNLEKWIERLGIDAVQLVQYGGIADTILKAISELKIGLVIMGNRFSEDDENRYFGTLTDYLIKKSKAPILSVKSDIGHAEVNDIVFANEFNKPRQYFDALQDLQQLTNSTVHLLRINTPKIKLGEEEIYRNMEAFADENRLDKYTKNIHQSSDPETGIIEWVALHPYPILAVKNITRSGPSPLFRPKLSKRFFVRSNISTLIYND